MAPSRIRSTRLAAGYNSAAGTFRVLLLGEQSSVILKSFGLTNTAGAANNCQVYIVHAGSITVLFREDIPANTDAYWGGWVVLQDHDEIRVVAAEASIGWWFSGTWLEGTIDQTVQPMAAAELPALDLERPSF